MTAQDLTFKHGAAEIKRGRKIIATIFNRAEFYAFHRIKNRFSEQYPYSLEIKGVGIRECESLDDAIFHLNKYVTIWTK